MLPASIESVWKVEKESVAPKLQTIRSWFVLIAKKHAQRLPTNVMPTKSQ